MKDFNCPLTDSGGRGGTVWFPPGGQVEYLQIQRHGSGLLPKYRTVEYEVPRVCAEAIGIDCTAMDRPDRGVVWFNREQSEALRSHRHAHFLGTG